MEILKKEKIQQRGLGTLKNPFVEAKTTGSESLEPVPHLKLHFPSYRGGNNQQLDYKTDTELFTTKSSLRVAKEELIAVNEGAPKFDEDPSDNKEDWHCEELICKALGLEDSFKAKQNSEGNFTDAKGLECTSTFKSDDKEDLEVPIQLESQMTKDLTTFIQMEELRLQQPIPCSHSYCLDKKSCKFSREEGLVFDPGGSMQDNWSKSVMNLVMNQQHDSHQDCLPRLTTVKFLVNRSNKVLENGGEPKFADFNSVEEQDVVEEKPSTNLINMRLLIENASWRGSLTAAKSYGLDKNSSYLGKKDIIIFDPGGQMHKPPLQFKGFCNTTITKLPNEGTLECTSKCSDFKFKLDEEEIQVEGWKVELPEWNLIIGDQWLSQLGELHCNYGMQHMQFEWHDKKLKLTSDSILDLVGSCHHFTAVIPRWIEHICGSYEVDEKQDANEEVFSIITTNVGKSAEAFEKFPTAKNSSNFKTNVHVFDSGGHMLNDHSKRVTKLFRKSPNHAIDQVVINEQYIDSMRAGEMARAYRCTVPRQDSPSKVRRIEVQEAWRRKYAITIFDPGGRKLSSEDQP